MSHAITSATPATLADDEAFGEGRPDEERWELIDGVIEMLTTPTERHGAIVGNIFAPLKLSVDGHGCRAFAGNLLVQRSDDRDDDMATISDIMVRCDPIRDRNFATDPTIVVEVLSRTTIHEDRGPKFVFDKRLPSLRHLVFVDQDQMCVEHDRRAAEGWSFTVLRRPSDRVDLDAVDSPSISTSSTSTCRCCPAEPPEGYEDDVPDPDPVRSPSLRLAPT